MRKNIGSKIKSLCLERGLTVEELENLLGVNPGSVARWKSSQLPHHTLLQKTANYLNVSIDYVIGLPTKSINNHFVATFPLLDEHTMTVDDCDQIKLFLDNILSTK